MPATADERFQPRIRPRLYLSPGLGIGPGKIELLQQVARTASISAAARAMGMSYKRAWQLIDEINQGLGRPVVATAIGGKGGGGARLTALGSSLVERYLALEAELNRAAAPHLAALAGLANREPD
jgi:molybdate transport system regulatory protein